MQLVKNIMFGILSLQEKFLRHRLAKTIGVKNSSKRKRHFSNGCVLDLNSLAESEKQKLEEEINLILKKYEYNPEKLLEYIKKSTKVFYLENAPEILNPIGENEGFIYPVTGAKALYLSLTTERKLSFKTKEMFVLSPGKINKYLFIYHFL